MGANVSVISHSDSKKADAEKMGATTFIVCFFFFWFSTLVFLSLFRFCFGCLGCLYEICPEYQFFLVLILVLLLQHDISFFFFCLQQATGDGKADKFKPYARSLDLIISTNASHEMPLKGYLSLLRPGGILIRASRSIECCRLLRFLSPFPISAPDTFFLR